MHISLYPLFKHVINIYFGHSGAVEINCTHKAEILSLHTVHMANVLAKRCLIINTRQIWSIYLEFCFWPPGISKSNIYSLLALSFVFTNSCGKFRGYRADKFTTVSSLSQTVPVCSCWAGSQFAELFGGKLLKMKQ